MTKTVVELMQNLRITFDRKKWRAQYDSKYFKQSAECPKCGSVVRKHMLKRHQQTRKCARKEFDKILTTLAAISVKDEK